MNKYYKNYYFFSIILVICLLNISISSFAETKKLKSKITRIFQKLEKKSDKEITDNASKTLDAKSNKITNASSSKVFNMENFNLLPQNQVKIEILNNQKILKNFDNDNNNYYCCQGFTTDGEYFYVALLSKGKESEKHTKILKIKIDDFSIVKEQDLGPIGHSNSLTYNSKTKKIYTAPLWKNYKCIYEFDRDLNNLKEIYLYNKDGSIIKDKQYWSVTYLPSEDQYIVKINFFTLYCFNSNFRLEKIIKVKQGTHLKQGNTSQALSSDGINLYSVTNEFKPKPNPKTINYILIYDMFGNYIDKYTFPTEFGKCVELQQISFNNGDCYALSVFNGSYKIYRLTLKQNDEKEK